MKHKLFLFLALAPALAGCDPSVSHEFYLHNATSGKICLYQKGTVDTILPDSKALLGSDAGIILAPEHYFAGGTIAVAWLEIDSITSGTAAYHKDLADSANWSFSRTGKYDYEHVLEVHQDDF